MTDIVTKDQADLAVRDQNAVPVHLQNLDPGYANAGMEEVRQGDIIMPRLWLMQALTPEVAEKGIAKPGEIWDNVDQSLLIESGVPFKFCVIKHRLCWIRWKPLTEGGGIIEQAYDVNSALAKEFGSYTWDKDEKRDIVEYHDFVVFLPEINKNRLYMMSCGKTQHKHGRGLISKMKMRGPSFPAFAGVYECKTVNETNKKNQTYKVFEFTNAGWADTATFEQAKKFYDSIGTKPLKVSPIDAREGDEELGKAETEI